MRKHLVWIDTDTAVGEPAADVDDGFALLQALHSPELQVAGVSTVFGNAARADCDRIASELLTLAGATDVPLHSGATGAESLGRPTPASRALARELRNRQLTIIALGPLTNIATVLLTHPELGDRIEKIVFVGGRRPGQRFTIADQGPLPDFNVECDPLAVEQVLMTNIPLTLAGFEVSTYATITSDHLDRLADGPPAARWLAASSRPWTALWRDRFGYRGFHPFDTLAVGVVATPELITVEPASAALVPVAQAPPGDIELHASWVGNGRSVVYATCARRQFVDDLLKRLLA